MTKSKVTRVQLDIPNARIADLDRLQALTGLTTRKDLFENALTFFEWAVTQSQAGRTILSDSNGKTCQLLMPAIANAKGKRL